MNDAEYMYVLAVISNYMFPTRKLSDDLIPYKQTKVLTRICLLLMCRYFSH